MAEGQRPLVHRPAALALVLATVLGGALGGCASIPTSGPVQVGAEAPEERRPYRVAPVGPAAGATPSGVVGTFLQAAVGSDDDFSAARSHLVSQGRADWRPGARIVVHADGQRSVELSQAGVALAAGAEADPSGGPVDAVVVAAVTAVVDEHGVYQAAPSGTVERMSLRLVRQEGQWRIDAVPDELLLDVSDFGIGWAPRTLYFPDPAGERLVPEVRWFADRASAPTTAVAELLRGPSAWLAPATRREHARAVVLATDSVPVEDGTAQVDLSASALESDEVTRALLVQQLQATLLPLPAVDSVLVTAEGGALSGAPAGAPLPVGVRVDPAPVVLVDGAVHRWDGAALTPLPGLTAPLPVPGPLEVVAVSGDVAAALVAGRTTLLRWQGAGPPVVALTAPPGGALTAPSVDPRGWVWSTATTSDGTLTAVGTGDEVAVVSAPWLAGRTVVSVRASREGARAVVVSTAPDGSDPRVDIAGLERAGDGTPQALHPAGTGSDSPTPWLTGVVAAVWVDATTVAVLGTAERGRGAGALRQVFLLTGGGVTALGAPGPGDAAGPAGSAGSAGPAPEIVGLAAGEGARSLLLASADGQVFQRAGRGWTPVAALAGARAPAFAG